MKIGTIGIMSSKTDNMKKSIKKILNASMRKLKQHKERIKMFKFSNFQEDFVITEQEEREGGFFGQLNFKNNMNIQVQ